MTDWGLLPEAAVEQLRAREWSNNANLRGLLSGARPFPRRVSLKAPTDAQALADPTHFQRFVDSWKQWPHAGQLQWQRKQFRRMGEQQVPVVLQIDSIQELIKVLGPKAEARSRYWEQRMRPLLSVDADLSPVLLQHLADVEKMTPEDAALLARLLPQLYQGIGQGGYLRALPLIGVDTKFVETWQTLIADLLDRLHGGTVTEQGGLLNWLNCRANPAGWLLVRPLCRRSRERLAELPVVQLDTRTLQRRPLPAARILIVENKQSGYALPELDDTIAVFGGGRNTAWMQAAWLGEKRIGYWGDIDSWGLTILSEARKRQPHLQALLMDEPTLLWHQARMVDEPTPLDPLPENLTAAEQQLFCRLRDGFYGRSRLEQERLSPDFVRERLDEWCCL
jgi:hypothetical protein